METLRAHNEQLRALLEEETKKFERLARDRNKSIKNLAEAESGGTLTDKLEKVTRDSIKKSTTINELQRDFDKKAAQRSCVPNGLD